MCCFATVSEASPGILSTWGALGSLVGWKARHKGLPEKRALEWGSRHLPKLLSKMKLRTAHLTLYDLTSHCLQLAKVQATARNTGWMLGRKRLGPRSSSLLSCPLLSKAFHDYITKITTPDSPSSSAPSPFPALFLPAALSPSHMLCTFFIGLIAFLLPLQWSLWTSTREEGHDHDLVIMVIWSNQSMDSLPMTELLHPQCRNAWHTIFIIRINDQPSPNPTRVQWGPRIGRRHGGGRYKDASTW